MGITKAVLGLNQVDLIAPGFIPTGEYFLMPDLKSLRTFTLEPRYAYIMGQFEEKEDPVKEVALCPRTILQRIVRYPFTSTGVVLME